MGLIAGGRARGGIRYIFRSFSDPDTPNSTPIMDQELVSLLQSPDRERAARGAQMLAAFLSRASFPSKSVQALREVTPKRSRRAAVLCVEISALCSLHGCSRASERVSERASVRARACLHACLRACACVRVLACVRACVREPHLR